MPFIEQEVKMPATRPDPHSPLSLNPQTPSCTPSPQARKTRASAQRQAGVCAVGGTFLEGQWRWLREEGAREGLHQAL